jgi:PAS domain S-box-containing protein
MANSGKYPSSYDELITIKDLPVAAINQESFFTFINPLFEKTYGYKLNEIMGHSVTTIMPVNMRKMHMIGFSRFLSTENPRLIGKPVNVSVLCKNKEVKEIELFILGKKTRGEWGFAAILNPVKPENN